MSAQKQVEQFAAGLEIVPCVKTSVPQLIGFYGSSGGGKTVTALVCLVGMVGPRVKIGVVDTENRRAGVAADVVKKMCLNHYKEAPEIVVVNLEEPFHPLKYVAALDVLKKALCGAFLVDSMSHAWSGNGGYLDLKEEALDRMVKNLPPNDPGYWKKREACAMAAAAQTKPHTHGKLVNAILQMRGPTVLCFRSKDKTVISRDQGRTKIETDPFGTPIQEATMIYEMLISGEVFAKDGIGGFCSFRGDGPKKTTHPDILRLLPQEGEQFGFGHGKALADWCSAPGGSQMAPQSAVAPSQAAQAALPLSSPSPAAPSPAAPAQAPASPPVTLPDQAEAKARREVNAELWAVTAPYRPAGERNWTATRQWLWDNGLLPQDKIPAQMTVAELKTMVETIKAM